MSRIGLCGKRLDRRQDLLAGSGQAGIDQQGALLADLHRDVAAGAENRIHVVLDVQDLELACRRRAGAALRKRLARARRIR